MLRKVQHQTLVLVKNNHQLLPNRNHIQQQRKRIKPSESNNNYVLLRLLLVNYVLFYYIILTLVQFYNNYCNKSYILLSRINPAICQLRSLKARGVNNTLRPTDVVGQPQAKVYHVWLGEKSLLPNCRFYYLRAKHSRTTMISSC